MNSDDFGQIAKPTAIIRNILDNYPFSVGILRELLQNSDDAGATEQVFLLDHRTHPSQHLISGHLSQAQGPALLAFNNAVFQPEDWIALQNISESSKRTDTSKIGKYGIGFRSCYHQSGRRQKNLARGYDQYSDHIHAMNLGILGGALFGGYLKGTVIRLPLRCEGAQSEISRKTLTAGDIHQLLVDFVQEELDITMLFLSSVRSVRLVEVDDSGVRNIGEAQITRIPLSFSSGAIDTRQETVSVTVILGKNKTDYAWRIIHSNFTMDEGSVVLSERLGRNVMEDLRREKLSPLVSLAFTAPLAAQTLPRGRLFTFLPLPLPTGFPCHIHSLFALTPSRQNLRNAVETGVVHGARDELLVEWNKVLFEVFIPRSWAAALEELVKDAPQSLNIWQAWPPASQETPGGDSSYWTCLVQNFVRVLVDEQRAVWPLVGQDTFTHLHDVLLATSPEDHRYLVPLSAAGVQITAPPIYIVHTICKGMLSCDKLTPYNAHQILLKHISQLRSLHPQDRDIVRDFLLSTGDATLVAGIPVISLISGKDVALELRQASFPETEYALLCEDDVPVFQTCADNLIRINQLPADFVVSAPDVLNVAALGCPQVVGFIDAVTISLEHSARLMWLRRFWAWFVSWIQRDVLFSLISSRPLLFDNEHSFHPLSSPLYNSDGISNDVQEVLSWLGIRFLVHSFPPSVVAYLKQKSVLKSATAIFELLLHLQPGQLPGSGISQAESVHLAQHISYCLTLHRRSLTDELRHRLCMIPVFPVIKPASATTTMPIFASVQQGSQVVVCDTGNAHILNHNTAILLPAVANVVFTARHYAGFDTTTLVSFADTSFRNQLSENDIVDLIITHLTSQTRSFQNLFLRQVLKHRHRIPPQSIQKLGMTEFVPVPTGLLKAPRDVVDPDADVALLFGVGDTRLPRILDSDVQAVVNSLRSLQLLQTSLSDEIIRERLRTIHDSQSSKSSHQCAVHLLRLLQDTQYSCSNLFTELQLSWLPTGTGLRRPTQCRDQTPRFNRALFDHVLDVLNFPSYLTSSSLREALGWNELIPLDIIKRQLDAILRVRPERLSTYVSVILIELGCRLEELQSLPEMTRSFHSLASSQAKPWIPTSDSSYSTTSRALLGDDRPPPGFRKISGNLLSNEGVREVLSLIGCSLSPTNSALLEEVHLTHGVKDVIRLLKAIDLSSLSDHDRERLPIPDVDAHLRPLSEIYFDDMGTYVYEVEPPQDRYRSHDDVKAGLVAKLGIHTLSSLDLKRVELDDEDMYEDLTTRISNVLRQYSLEQAPNEFLANAVDAGADQYVLMLDQRQYPNSRVMFEEMTQFQTSPALIIYNNAVFTDSDWKGIRQVGLGGKLDRTDAIGRFGLGALSMFHFTEVPMVVSGTSVMFLDPGRKYLPPNGKRARNHIRVPISHMRRCHPDHLATIDGVEGFDVNSDHFNGTIFRLPLRTGSQAATSLVSKRALDHQEVISLLNSYGDSAQHCILNVPVRSMESLVRNYAGLRPLWSVKATRQEVNLARLENTACERINLEFTTRSGNQLVETWHSITESVMLDSLPPEFGTLTLNHKMRRHLSITLAGRVPIGHENKLGNDVRVVPHGRLYSRLPLPTFTCLPIHVDAPFILAEDRRSIRYEESGQLNDESRYNWLLSNRIPPLYAALLEAWPVNGNKAVWPGVSLAESDPISCVIIKAFYDEYFASSPLAFCETSSGDRLPPSKALFLRTEPDSVMSIISLLKPLSFVKLPSRVRSLLPSDIPRVDAHALRNMINSNIERIITLHRGGHIDSQALDVLLSRMLQEHTDSVIGIKMLPLADDSFGVIERSAPAILAREPSGMSEETWSTIFPLNRFLHLDVQRSKNALIDLNLNVHQFNGSQAVRLLAETIGPSSVATLSLEQEAKLNAFLDHIDRLNISLAGLLTNEIQSIPLVPTSKQGIYISLSHSAMPSVLAMPSQPHIARILESMASVHLVPKAICSPFLRAPLASLSCAFGDILQAFEQQGSVDHILPEMAAVQPGDHEKFATYARQQLHTLRIAHTTTTGKRKNKRTTVTYTVNHSHVARSLPIWKAQRNGNFLFVSDANSSLRMLPKDAPLSVVSAFLDPAGTFIDFDSGLKTVLNVQPMSFADLYTCLHFPTIARSEELSGLKRVVTLLVGCRSHVSIPSLKMPNVFGRIVESTTLYAYSNPIFRAAFEATNPQNFLHPQFRDMESSLANFGFNYSMTMSSFVQCALAVHREFQQSGRSQGASIVFSYYNDQLWTLVPGSGNSQVVWHSLDGLNFIPTSNIRRKYANGLDLGFADYARILPQIVSPNEVLRPECEAVAWTQRVLFDAAPSERLLIAYPSLGVPTVAEVVEHLRVLKMIADRHPHNGNLINDITETYQWLDNRADDCRSHLQAYASDQLFLNVDNPHISWSHAAANQIIFNGRDESERQRARTFLMPFRRLLLAAGAKEVSDAVRPVLKLTDAEEVLHRWRHTVNNYRLNQQMTDVVLRSSDGREFRAHRLVLSAETKYLEAMLSGRWDESVPMMNVTGHILEHILDFIYTRKIPFADVDDNQLFDHQDELIELIEICHIWNMPTLFKVVENQLIATISLGSYEALEELATNYDASDLHADALRDACVDFRIRNVSVL